MKMKIREQVVREFRALGRDAKEPTQRMSAPSVDTMSALHWEAGVYISADSNSNPKILFLLESMLLLLFS